MAGPRVTVGFAPEHWLWPEVSPQDGPGPESGLPRRADYGRGDLPLPRRALLLGAGFSMAAMPGVAKAFGPTMQHVARQLWGTDQTTDVYQPDKHVSEVADAALLRRDRSWLARQVLADPLAGDLRLQPAGYVNSYEGLQGDLLYRPLKDWRRLLSTQHPTHLPVLRPASPILHLARLVAEGVVQTVVSTNWDALIELGLMLSGMRVIDAGDDDPHKLRTEPWLAHLRSVQVWESGDDALLRPARDRTARLFKVHGGVRSIRAALERGQPEGEQALERSFMVSTNDLIRWEGPTQWVSDTVNDTLRSHTVLTLGVSGQDPVTFKAVRQHAESWSQAHRRQALGPRSPGVFAVGYSPDLRLCNMVAYKVRAADGPEELNHPLVADPTNLSVLEQLYALWWLEGLSARAWPEGARPRWCEEVFHHVRAGAPAPAERDPVLPLGEKAEGADAPPVPRVQEPSFTQRLITRSLAPALRWAALAEGWGPLQASSPTEPLRRWWFAPWGLDDPTRPGIPSAHAREILALLALLSTLERHPQHSGLEDWTGLVWVPKGALPGLRESVSNGNDAGFWLMPLPWPWPAGRGLGSAALRRALRLEFGWGRTRVIRALGQAPVVLAPAPLPHFAQGAAPVLYLEHTRALLPEVGPQDAERFWSKLVEGAAHG